jgi:methionyl aminopeptidase
MRNNAKIHKKVFEEIKKILKAWINAMQVDEICSDIAKKHWVLCWFKWVYWFPNNVCISVNDVVVHWRPRNTMIFKDGDLVTIDFWIKDKNFWINTDAAFSVIIGWDDKNPIWAKLIEVNKKALYAWIDKARAWNTVWDISNAIQKEVEEAGFKIVKELTWHCIWKKMHEKPYIPNYWKAWTWEKLKKWMTIAIEPIIWETSWLIFDKDDWEIYIKDWSLWCQYEHTILITDGQAEIII